MFSTEYNVAAALARGRFTLAELEQQALDDAELRRLTDLARVDARSPRHADIVYDPLDPDYVELRLADGTELRQEVALPTGTRDKPMAAAARRAKFDDCLQQHHDSAARDALWLKLNDFESIVDVDRELML